ncbi:hypothetical protein BDV25DRAFT_161561 [Aspergillus avenaceus]|uniref:Arrestin-like N-terminal domain-containing protein n=1 Tax=Aspergillus avenaceus TaxID=36643 RepID=A0A5N6TLB5_ASPAV|nr:hypothetical protein BDV25DRAFT_161561 [Aspergillus avenaceus]
MDPHFDRRTRPRIVIDLNDERDGLVNCYTTGDEIQGKVTVTTEHDLPFHSIHITFEGISETAVEPPGTIINRTRATHRFLKLSQPIEPNRYPENHTLQKGITYPFAFTFVVPDYLLPQSCNHPTGNWALKDAHTRVPPSLGDPVQLHDPRQPLDDYAPAACRIGYVIKVVVLDTPFDDGGISTTAILAAVGKKVHVVPTVDEDPPLSVPPDSTEYRPWLKTVVRQGLSRSITGRLILSAVQPRPLQVRLGGLEPSTTTGILATLHLRFDPIANERPPQLDALCSQLKIVTFLTVRPFTDFPTNSLGEREQMNRRAYQHVIPLLNVQITSVPWIQRTERVETAALRTPEGICPHRKFYTASVAIPTSLPSGKSFPPTFHSCYISRIYILKLKVSYLTFGLVKKTNSIKLPLQIIAGRPAEGRLGSIGSRES